VKTKAELKALRLNLQAFIKEQIPQFEERSKEDSLFMTILGKILFFIPDFKDKFVTTIYPIIYFPKLPFKRYTISEEKNEETYIGLLSHEFVHLYDRKRLGAFFFNFLYTAPQIMALLALLGFFTSSWFFLCILFLAPLPSFGRAWLEYRGYRASIVVNYWLTGTFIPCESIIPYFSSSFYYWMFPFKRLIQMKYNKIILDTLAETIEINNKELALLSAVLKAKKQLT